MDDILKEVHTKVCEIKEDIAEIKVDVRHHIKRSDMHEISIMELSRFKERVLGAIALLAFLGTMITVYEVFK